MSLHHAKIWMLKNTKIQILKRWILKVNRGLDFFCTSGVLLLSFEMCGSILDTPALPPSLVRVHDWKQFESCKDLVRKV